jgi:RNA polymerase sigma factor (sigma-70 family)
MLDLILAGDRAAEEEFARQFYPRLLAMACARLRRSDLARDIAQEAVMEALQSLRRGMLREPEKLAAFVHGVGRNLINQHFRRESVGPSVRELPAELPAVMPDPSERERRELVAREIERLDEIDRKILTMTLVDGAKPGAIAAALGLDGGVVRQRKLRATRRISERLSQMTGGIPLGNRGDERDDV